jgi:hypothetical protein
VARSRDEAIRNECMNDVCMYIGDALLGDFWRSGRVKVWMKNRNVSVFQRSEKKGPLAQIQIAQKSFGNKRCTLRS